MTSPNPTRVPRRRAMRAALAGALATAAVLAGAWPGPAPAPATAAREAASVTLRHAATGFSATAPSGYRLRVTGGVYRITGPGLTVTVRIVRTTRGARVYGESVRPSGTIVLRAGNARRYRVVTDVTGRRTDLLVVRRGADLVVTTGVYSGAKPALAARLAAIAASVRGGSAGASPGAAKVARLVPLRPYRAPDGGATAWVPSDPDWTISSVNGALEGSGPRGRILLGQTFSINLPGSIPPGALPAGGVIAPYANAADALTQVWPLINRAVGVDVGNVRIRSLVADATIPSFRSSGMLVYDFTSNGRAWVGIADVATEDRLGATPFFWQMYISTIAVPADGDPTVGAALRLVWRSWNPGGAIAARTAQARQVLAETNQIWQGVSEFRSRTADQQSRDVSCLLRTGPFVDDHARELGLPPLTDCDSTYTQNSR